MDFSNEELMRELIRGAFIVVSIVAAVPSAFLIYHMCSTRESIKKCFAFSLILAALNISNLLLIGTEFLYLTGYEQIGKLTNSAVIILRDEIFLMAAYILASIMAYTKSVSGFLADALLVCAGVDFLAFGTAFGISCYNNDDTTYSYYVAFSEEWVTIAIILMSMVYSCKNEGDIRGTVKISLAQFAVVMTAIAIVSLLDKGFGILDETAVSVFYLIITLGLPFSVGLFLLAVAREYEERVQEESQGSMLKI